MASNLSNGHVPASGTLLATKQSEHLDGYIDLKILIDIEMSLSQSESMDDVALAAWIKQNYLQEPLSEIGRPIRDAEGYANLEKAYRRVRQLTGKAKDEWPFFDRNWKKLPSTVVKNAILGDTAMCTTRFHTNGQLRDTLMHNHLGGQHGRFSLCINQTAADSVQTKLYRYRSHNHLLMQLTLMAIQRGSRGRHSRPIISQLSSRQQSQKLIEKVCFPKTSRRLQVGQRALDFKR